MKIFKSFQAAVMPAVQRFPAAFLLILCAAIFLSAVILNQPLPPTSKLWHLFEASYWGMALALFASLLLETRKSESEKRRRLLFLTVQAAAVILSAALWSELLIPIENSSRRMLIYVCTFFALTALSVYLLKYTQKKERIIPNIFVSCVIAEIVSFAVFAGLALLAAAVKVLLYDYDMFDYVLPIISVVSGMFFHYFFIAYSTKPDERIVLPKAFLKVLMLYILFPIYLLLILLLYVYLLKSLVTLALPQGEINWFVSFATVFYLVFYFMLSDYKNPVVNFFYRYGSLFLFPLIIIQCIAFGIRIYHYGYTEARYASLLYIIFSFVFCSLPLLKRGKYMPLIFPLFAVILLLASVTPLNLQAMPVRSQSSRIFAVLRKYDLCEENRVVVKDEGVLDSISQKDRLLLKSSFDMISEKERQPEWLKACKEELSDEQLAKLFAHPDSDDVKHFVFSADTSVELDISGFREMYYISCGNRGGRLTVTFGSSKQETLDITEELISLYESAERHNESKPLIIKKDGYTLFINNLNLNLEELEQKRQDTRRLLLDGFIMR